MSNENIIIDLNEYLTKQTVSIDDANKRFCFAAAGLPSDVVNGFLDLLEAYGNGCSAVEEVI